MPEAVAGASGAYQVASGKSFQALHPLSYLCKRISPRAITWQPQTSSTQSSTSPHLQREARQSGNNLGLSQHNLTSVIVPKSVLKSRVDDFACDEASQTEGRQSCKKLLHMLEQKLQKAEIKKYKKKENKKRGYFYL